MGKTKQRVALLAAVAAGICLAAALALVLPGSNTWRKDRQFKREHSWIQQAMRELQFVGPPPAEAVRAATSGRWETEVYLIFTNSWAAFKHHSWHCDDGMDDMTVLRVPRGSFYLSHCHF